MWEKNISFNTIYFCYNTFSADIILTDTYDVFKNYVVNKKLALYQLMQDTTF